jgi:hypothetical protein
MKREVFVIGCDLKELVPFCITFAGPDFSVTLVETDDVVRRASTLAEQHAAWFLLILSPDQDDEAERRLECLAPTTSLVIHDCDDPLVALCHLIAADAWEATTTARRPESAVSKAEETHG